MSAATKHTLLFKPNVPCYDIGIMKVTQFGVLKSVDMTETVNNDQGWITLENEDGDTVKMKKIYAGWLGIFLKAQKLIGKPIVYETGSSAPADDFFRDIYEDSPTKPMLSFPENISNKAKLEIILARLAASSWKWEHDKAKDSLALRLEQMEDQQARLQLLEKQDYDEVRSAAQQLDRDWDDWVANPQRKLLLQGAANHGGRIQNLDRKFMLRLNIDISGSRNIPVTMIGRGENNYVRVKLPSFDNLECEVGVKRSTQRGTKGQWGICTVRNEYDGWFRLENELFPSVKTLNWSLEQCGEAHHEMIAKLLDQEVTSHLLKNMDAPKRRRS